MDSHFKQPVRKALATAVARYLEIALFLKKYRVIQQSQLDESVCHQVSEKASSRIQKAALCQAL